VHPLPKRLDDPFHAVLPARASGLLERPGDHASMEPAMAQEVARASERLFDGIVADGT